MDVHASAAKLLADLADPKARLDGALADLQKKTAARAEARKEPAARLDAAREKSRVAHVLRDQSWALLAAAAAGRLDLEALTELEAAWASPETVQIAKSTRALVALRSLWAVTESARALPQETELGGLAKYAQRIAEPAAREALAAIEKSPNDPRAMVAAVYAAMALKDDAERVGKARQLLAEGKGADPSLAGIRTVAAALLAPPKEIDRKPLVALVGGQVGGEDMVVLAAMACRRAGGDAWNAFRAESRRIVGEQPLPGSVVILVSNLARPNLALAVAKAGK
jgi:hypothetical protein